jgi:negative regulator of sigma E activity
MMRGSLLALVLGAASLAFAGANTANDTGYTLLFAAMSASSSVSYTGLVHAVRIGDRGAQAAVYRIEHRAPGLTRRVYSSPSDLSADSMLSRGDLLFSIDAKRRRIVETRADAFDDPRLINGSYALVRQNYRAVREDSETFDGRRAIDLALINKYTGRPTMVLRIDEANKMVLDKEEFAPGGSLVSELRFEEIRYVTPSASDFTLPRGYALEESSTFGETPESADRGVEGAGFAVREPRSLPDGFVPVQWNLVTMRGVRTVHLLYSDGVRTVSLFENAKASTLGTAALQPRSLRVGNHDALYAEDEATALLAWSDGSLYYTLVSEAGLVDLERIAASIAR